MCDNELQYFHFFLYNAMHNILSCQVDIYYSVHICLIISSFMTIQECYLFSLFFPFYLKTHVKKNSLDFTPKGKGKCFGLPLGLQLKLGHNKKKGLKKTKTQGEVLGMKDNPT